MLPQLDPNEYFARTNPETNLIEVVSITTGQVVQLLGDIHKIHELPQEFVEVKRADGSSLMVQKGIDLDNLPTPGVKQPYSHTLASIFCEHIATGTSLTKACQLPGMPSYSTVRHWRRRNEEFARMLDQALQDRADYLHDQALEIAMDRTRRSSAEDMSNDRLAIDQLNRTAEKANPSRYGNKVQHTGEVKHSVALVIETGIRRNDDPNFYRDETAKIREAQGIKIEGEVK